MDKIYIRVHEILEQCGFPLPELLVAVKNGEIPIYEYKKSKLDYLPVNDFASFVNDYVIFEKKRTEDGFKEALAFIDSEIDKGVDKLYTHYGDLGGIAGTYQYINQLEGAREGEKKKLRHKYERKLQLLEDVEDNERYVLKNLFVKYLDFTTFMSAKNIKPKKSGGRNKDTERIEKTKQACSRVQDLYRDMLPTTKKPIVKRWVQNEMGGIEPHNQTFNDWFRECEFTRGAGNPNNK